jgi:hypothetical protein
MFQGFDVKHYYYYGCFWEGRGAGVFRKGEKGRLVVFLDIGVVVVCWLPGLDFSVS